MEVNQIFFVYGQNKTFNYDILGSSPFFFFLPFYRLNDWQNIKKIINIESSH